MRETFFALWLLVPIVGYVLHVSTGDKLENRDRAAEIAAAADLDAESGNWSDAAAGYASALAKLPAGDQSRHTALSVALGRALVNAGDIVEGQEVLEKSIAALDAGGDGDGIVANSARAELAAASYFAAWFMRLEGGSAEEWTPETERARQLYRHLAETQEDGASESDGPHHRNLEATIRLAQMDLTELLAKPLPKNCPNCKNGLCKKKRKQSQSRCESQGNGKEKPEEQDVRKQIKKDSGAGIHSGFVDGS
jgi:hypothetical protein